MGIVVDDEKGTVGVTEAAESAGGAFESWAIEPLLTQLHDVDAAVQRGAKELLRILFMWHRVTDEIKACGSQPLASQRTVCLWSGKAHPPIMA